MCSSSFRWFIHLKVLLSVMMSETAYTQGQFCLSISFLATVIFQPSFLQTLKLVTRISHLLVFCVCCEQNCTISDSTTNLKEYEKNILAKKIPYMHVLVSVDISHGNRI